MLIATLLMALLCGGLALCVAELSTALPSAGGVFVYAQSAFGPSSVIWSVSPARWR